MLLRIINIWVETGLLYTYVLICCGTLYYGSNNVYLWFQGRRLLHNIEISERLKFILTLGKLCWHGNVLDVTHAVCCAL